MHWKYFFIKKSWVFENKYKPYGNFDNKYFSNLLRNKKVGIEI